MYNIIIYNMYMYRHSCINQFDSPTHSNQSKHRHIRGGLRRAGFADISKEDAFGEHPENELCEHPITSACSFSGTNGCNNTL